MLIYVFTESVMLIYYFFYILNKPAFKLTIKKLQLLDLQHYFLVERKIFSLNYRLRLSNKCNCFSFILATNLRLHKYLNWQALVPDQPYTFMSETKGRPSMLEYNAKSQETEAFSTIGELAYQLLHYSFVFSQFQEVLV